MEANPVNNFSLSLQTESLQHENWTRQQLENYQAQALRACREYVYTHSPFYQRFHRGLMDRPLQELPVLTKAMFNEHFDELVTDRAVCWQDVQQYLARADASRLYLDRYQVMATSGSTGQPGVFLSDDREKALVANTYTRFQIWGGVTPTSKAAVVASLAPAQMSSQFPIIINGKRVERLHLSASDPLEKHVQKLNDWQARCALLVCLDCLSSRQRAAPETLAYYSHLHLLRSGDPDKRNAAAH